MIYQYPYRRYPYAPQTPQEPTAPESLPGGQVAPAALTSQAAAPRSTASVQPRAQTAQPAAAPAPTPAQNPLLKIDWNLANLGQPGAYGSAPYQFQPVDYTATRRDTGAEVKPGTRAQSYMDRQTALLGPLAELLMPENQFLRRADIPLLESGLNWQQQLMSEADRQRGYEELVRGRSAIGMSPEAMLAKEAFLDMYNAGGPFGPGVQDVAIGGMRDAAARALQDQQAAMAGDYARRGLAGSPTSYESARLGQMANAGLQGQISDYKTQAAIANEEAMRAAMGSFQQQALQEQTMRAALDEMIANLFLETERAPIDLGSLLTKVPGAASPVGKF